MASAVAVAATGACFGAMLIPTTAGAWTSPARLSVGFIDVGNGDQVSEAMNPSGAGVVAWSRQITPSRSVLQARLRTANGRWRRVEDLELPGDPDGDDPAVAMDRSGDALAVWDGQTSHGQPNTDDPELEIADARPGGSFGPPALLASPDILGNTYPFAGFDAAGRALVMWSDEDHVWYAAREPHHGFGRPRQIENPNTSAATDNVQRPVYAMGADGTAVVAWYFYGAIYAAYRPAGGAFGPVRELNPVTAGAQTDSTPQVAIGHGQAIVSWTANMRSYSSEQIVVAASRRESSDQTTFSPPQSVLTGAFLGGLAMNAAGQATIVGQGVALHDAAGAAIVRSPSGALSTPQSLGPTVDGPIYGVFRVAYDPGGNVFVAWRHLKTQLYNDTHGDVYGEERPAGGRFTEKPVSVSGAARDPLDPLVVTGAPGEATIVWATAPKDASTVYVAASDRGRPGAARAG